MISPFYAMITGCNHFYDVLEIMVERRYNRSIPFHLPEYTFTYLLHSCTTESKTQPKIPKQRPFSFENKRQHLKIHKAEQIAGECLTWIPRISAPAARNSVMRLVRLNGAVSHRPAGTVSLPPPLSAIAATAASNAAVFTVLPSPNAPNSLRS